MGEINNQETHFVLIHGSSAGAWVWYKVKPTLDAAGHNVTALDMSASGVNTKTLEEVQTFDQYNEPLIEFLANLPENEKVVLVGHSLGGLNLAFAMEKFPEKISLAIFVTAILPDTQHQPSYMLEKFLESSSSAEEEQGSAVVSSTPFQLTPIEDLTLLALLNRPGSMFVESLSEANKLTDCRYGSVPRVYIVCTEDILLSPSIQRFMIEQNEVKEVMEIPADHMAVFSKPKELSQCILELSQKHS
ncbi:hypothetical protein SADUNF_Sadunf05G0099200 [Salix dunnii]|uniref:(S)-hydroxynitrile lyase n=1 Tax=Salix dunnii TaxID=1413687 RepID=A0A835N3L9_9ROSI|nr:hypothetical protein SADUNF_Sadunf05G0099200 [Salix dunnii]